MTNDGLRILGRAAPVYLSFQAQPIMAATCGDHTGPAPTTASRRIGGEGNYGFGMEGRHARDDDLLQGRLEHRSGFCGNTCAVAGESRLYRDRDAGFAR